MPYAEPALKVDARLTGERHAGFEHRVYISFVQVRRFVCFDSDAMAYSVREVLAVSRGRDDVSRGYVDVCSGGVGREGGNAGCLGGQDERPYFELEGVHV